MLVSLSFAEKYATVLVELDPPTSDNESPYLPYCIKSIWHNNTVTNTCFETEDEMITPNHCLTNREAICYFMYENEYMRNDYGCAVSTNMADVCEYAIISQYFNP